MNIDLFVCTDIAPGRHLAQLHIGSRNFLTNWRQGISLVWFALRLCLFGRTGIGISTNSVTILKGGQRAPS